jgi:hypothetical protein
VADLIADLVPRTTDLAEQARPRELYAPLVAG